MRKIFNEGRSVGLSAYEIYVRQALSNDAHPQILTEREWIAATMKNGSSMILKVAAGTPAGYIDFLLPEESSLCACTTITASLFDGDIITDGGPWATEVLSYGRLISNTEDLHPETPGGVKTPTYTHPEVIPEDYAEKCRNYIKITSGLALQPGQWTRTRHADLLVTEYGDYIVTENNQQILVEYGSATGKRPYMKVKPILSSAIHTDQWVTEGIEGDLDRPIQPVTTEDGEEILIDWRFDTTGAIRLAITEEITSDVLILLSGFSIKAMVEGSAGFYLSDTSSAANGGFLGPEEYPWGTKVMLNVTTDVMYVLYHDIMNAIGGH